MIDGKLAPDWPGARCPQNLEKPGEILLKSWFAIFFSRFKDEWNSACSGKRTVLAKQQRILRPKVVPHGLKLHGLRLGLKVEELCKGNSFASFQNQQESATALFTAHSQERRAFSYYIFPWIGTKKTKFTGSWNEFISSSGCVVHKLTMQDFQSDAK